MAMDWEKGWLRGFFDGEGGAYLSRYGKKQYVTYSIGAFGTSKELLDYASKCLNNLQIRHKVYHTRNRGTKSGFIYQLRIAKRPAIIRFAELINFTESRKRQVLSDILEWINRPNRRPNYGRDENGRFLKRPPGAGPRLHYARKTPVE